MKRAAWLVSLAAFGLAGCDLLFPEDKRLGVEAENICIGRVRAKLTHDEYQQLENAPGRWVPTYPYDITKLDLAAIQALSAGGADETQGTRLMRQTNSTAAAVQRFKTMAVDRKGALFLGQEPSLYRVRGKVQPASQILSSGCERQQANMRLIEVSWVRQGAQRALPQNTPKPEDEPEFETYPGLGNTR